MGKDKQTHWRKTRKASELARNRNFREQKETVLIVCEGEKTEPCYFEDLKNHYQLTTADVVVCGEECGSAPKSVLEFAQKKYETSVKNGNPFDRVFCVFDKDEHDSYAMTVDAVKRKKPDGVFDSITSVPCFEYWFLLHFTYTTKSYGRRGNKSAGDCLIVDLKKKIPKYEKKQGNMFSELFDKLEVAIGHAETSLKYAETSDTDDPSTKVHKLVEYLKNLKS